MGPSQANGLSSNLWLAMNASFCSIIFLKSHYGNGHFISAQIIESLWIGQALNSLSFGWKLVISKYQTPKNRNFKLSTRALV